MAGKEIFMTIRVSSFTIQLSAKNYKENFFNELLLALLEVDYTIRVHLRRELGHENRKPGNRISAKFE